MVKNIAGLALGAFLAPMLAPALLGSLGSTGAALVAAKGITLAAIEGAIAGCISSSLSRGNILKSTVQGAFFAGFGKYVNNYVQGLGYAEEIAYLAVVTTSSLASTALNGGKVLPNMLTGIGAAIATLPFKGPTTSHAARALKTLGRVGATAAVTTAFNKKSSLLDNLIAATGGVMQSFAANHGTAQMAEVKAKKEVSAQSLGSAKALPVQSKITPKKTAKLSREQDVRGMPNRKPVSNHAPNPQPSPNPNQQIAAINRENIVKKMEENAGGSKHASSTQKSKSTLLIPAGKKRDEKPRNYATPFAVKKHSEEATNAFMNKCKIDTQRNQTNSYNQDKSTPNKNFAGLGKGVVASTTTNGTTLSNPMSIIGDKIRENQSRIGKHVINSTPASSLSMRSAQGSTDSSTQATSNIAFQKAMKRLPLQGLYFTNSPAEVLNSDPQIMLKCFGNNEIVISDKEAILQEYKNRMREANEYIKLYYATRKEAPPTKLKFSDGLQLSLGRLSGVAISLYDIAAPFLMSIPVTPLMLFLKNPIPVPNDLGNLIIHPIDSGSRILYDLNRRNDNIRRNYVNSNYFAAGLEETRLSIDVLMMISGGYSATKFTFNFLKNTPRTFGNFLKGPQIAPASIGVEVNPEIWTRTLAVVEQFEVPIARKSLLIEGSGMTTQWNAMRNIPYRLSAPQIKPQVPDTRWNNLSRQDIRSLSTRSYELSKAQRGILGESAPIHTLNRVYHQELPCRLPGNRGFDHVTIKYAQDGSVQEIFLIESKFSAKGTPHLRKGQMTEDAIRETITNMELSSDPFINKTAEIIMDNIEEVRLKGNVLDANGVNRWGDLTRKINKLHPSSSTFGREP